MASYFAHCRFRKALRYIESHAYRLVRVGAAHTRDEASRIAANIAKLPELLRVASRKAGATVGGRPIEVLKKPLCHEKRYCGNYARSSRRRALGAKTELLLPLAVTSAAPAVACLQRHANIRADAANIRGQSR